MILLRHLRRNVVAYLALFLALSGTSYAAVNTLLPRNSVGTAQLKAGAVTKAKIAHSTFASLQGHGSTLKSYLTAGTYQYVAPAGTTKLLVRLTGGGAAAQYGNNWYGGGGGGQGGTVEALVPVSGGATFTVVVGAGGAGGQGYGTGPPDPQAGNASTFASGANTLITADGGGLGGPLPGCPNSGEAGGVGGAGSVASPAMGLSLTPGADGGVGHADPGCGGNGVGGKGGGDGFAGAGGNGANSQVFDPTNPGSDGVAVIIAYTK